MTRTTFTFDAKPLPRTILRSTPVRAVLHDRAMAIARAVPGGGVGVVDERGRHRSRSAVITWSIAARHRERKRQTLTRTLRAARGGAL